MAYSNFLVFNAVFGFVFLLTSAKAFTKSMNERSNDVIQNIASTKPNMDISSLKLSKEDFSMLLSWMELLEQRQEPISPDQNVKDLFSLSNENPDQIEMFSSLPPSDNQELKDNTTNNVAEPTTSSKLNLHTERQSIEKRNPETEFIKTLLGYKTRNRVSYVNRKVKCLLAGLARC